MTALMLCTSVRSTSVKAMVPLSVRLPTGVTSSVTAPVTSVAATIGASLVPVMVTTSLRGGAAVMVVDRDRIDLRYRPRRPQIIEREVPAPGKVQVTWPTARQAVETLLITGVKVPRAATAPSSRSRSPRPGWPKPCGHRPGPHP